MPTRTSRRFNLISAALAFTLWGLWAYYVDSETAVERGPASPLSSDLCSAAFQPVFAERLQTRERFEVLLPACRFLTFDDVVQMANVKSLDFNPSLPGVVEVFDPVRREDQVEVKRTILELDEVLSPLKFFSLFLG